MKIAITGITGKMGQAVARAILQNDLNDISGALVRAGSNLVGQNIGKIIGIDDINVNATDNLQKLFADSDIVIDFSNPTLTLECARIAAKQHKILVSGTTGLSEEQKQELRNLGQETVIIWSANMSIGVNLLMNLAEKVAGILHDDFDAEIFEMHHRKKIDAPSGTALALGEAIAKGRNLNFGEVSRKTRDGIIGPRSKDEIGFSSLRGGDVIGDHGVIFAGNGERIELWHKASNRDIYALGAVRAAIWASAKSKGFYTMRDVLGS